MSRKPIKTALYAPPLGRDAAAWREELRRLDDSGLTAVSVSDHFMVGRVDPVAALAAIAMSTRRLRVMALVLCNDYRHPVITHHAAASVDVLSGGRLDLGLGAGYLEAEYAAAGLPYDPPGQRVDRLAESVEVIKALFADGPVHHEGAAYAVTGLTGTPAPVQTPHPPLLIGGGGKRMLAMAGQHAQIAGIHSNLRHGSAYNAAVIEDMLPDRMARKIAWVREAAERAGRDPDQLDYLSITWTCRVVDSPRRTDAALAEVCRAYGVDPAVGRQSTGLLVGTVEQCVEQLLHRQDELGLNYVDFGAANATEVAPLVAALSSVD
ncbi:TIGR03621 family F420-dependent LLM class oxidoreductase [Saccharopolyspora sp. WRP15-2]|uniref:TIGR03621 family F420-dependent LLM class oxidoreductase n=1 Tax=Saccharopolyspora oryzae TaxID=2997343 RepID=A0ABT4USP1_9PSEU|nr:TIGR03621 family F420-dependent LLM class oxidoreductase [Saccharopolyspora oryzae]MDA3624558.1 TIGR03621 family F420-dependent LLM class oxidoreductase [Saccharopolyspora oryzae]